MPSASDQTVSPCQIVRVSWLLQCRARPHLQAGCPSSDADRFEIRFADVQAECAVTLSSPLPVPSACALFWPLPEAHDLEGSDVVSLGQLPSSWKSKAAQAERVSRVRMIAHSARSRCRRPTAWVNNGNWAGRPPG